MSRVWKFAAVVVALVCIAIPTAFTSQATEWAMGDLFIGIGDLAVRDTRGKYAVLDGDTLSHVDDLVDRNRGYTAGCAVDPMSGYVWTTSLTGNTISVFGNDGLLQTVNLRNYVSPKGPARGMVGSLVFDAAGNVFAGTRDGTNHLLKLSGEGSVVDSSPMPRGVKWLDLAADQRTLYYTSDDSVVRRYDLATRSALPDLATLRDGSVNALRLLPHGQGLLVAGSISVSWLDLDGTVVQEYWLSGVTGFRGLNITPDGKSFWTWTEAATLYRFDIASTAVMAGPLAVGSTVNGLCIKLEYTAAEDSCRVIGGEGQPATVTCARLEACRNGADDDLDGVADAVDSDCVPPVSMPITTAPGSSLLPSLVGSRRP